MLNINDLRVYYKQKLTKLFVSHNQYTYLPVSMWSELNTLTEDFALHSIASLINGWYQNQSGIRVFPNNQKSQILGQPLNAYLKDMGGGNANHVSDSAARMLQRSSQKLRAINESYRETNRKQGYPVPDTNKPKSKREGILISGANMETIKNFTTLSEASELLNSIASGRIKRANSVDSETFADYFAKYEKSVVEIRNDLSDRDYLARAIDFYALQRKWHLDLIAEIARFMDIHDISSELPVEQIGLFWSTLNIGNRLVEASQVLTYNKVIPVIFSDDSYYLKNLMYLWAMLRCAQSDLTNQECKTGVWRALTVEFAVVFFGIIII